MYGNTVRAVVLLVLSTLAAADDWPMLGRDKTRNAVSPEKNPRLEWGLKAGNNIKWQAKLGSLAFAALVVAGPTLAVARPTLSPSQT